MENSGIAREVYRDLGQMRVVHAHVGELTQELQMEEGRLKAMVEKYTTRRIDLFVSELGARGLTWCTKCNQIVKEADARLMLCKGREEHSGGYGNSEYGFRNFSHFHRVCSACVQRLMDRHGYVGPRDRSTKDGAVFNAFQVEKREDGFYAREFGNWVKIEDAKCVLPVPPDDLVEPLAAAWGLPIKVEYGSDMVRGCHLVFREYPVPVAKAG
jgi:hypothetical protein